MGHFTKICYKCNFLCFSESDDSSPVKPSQVIGRAFKVLLSVHNDVESIFNGYKNQKPLYFSQNTKKYFIYDFQCRIYIWQLYNDLTVIFLPNSKLLVSKPT